MIDASIRIDLEIRHFLRTAIMVPVSLGLRLWSQSHKNSKIGHFARTTTKDYDNDCSPHKDSIIGHFCEYMIMIAVLIKKNAIIVAIL